jgi:hypothetical protein
MQDGVWKKDVLGSARWEQYDGHSTTLKWVCKLAEARAGDLRQRTAELSDSRKRCRECGRRGFSRTIIIYAYKDY